MGLDRTNLPDALLRRVSPADRKAAHLPPPLNQILTTRNPTTMARKRAETAIRATIKQPAKPKTHRSGYSLPVVLAFFEESGITEIMVSEYRFHPARKWRFDLCFPGKKLAVEVNGGIFSQGRHTRGAALLLEYEKLSEAAALGYRVIFTTPDQLCLTETAALIRRALAI